MAAAFERARNVAVIAAFGGFMGWAVLAWLTDPTSDAGCDDPRMSCTEAGTSPAGFTTTNTQESR